MTSSPQARKSAFSPWSTPSRGSRRSWIRGSVIEGEDVVASLEQTCAAVGYPRAIRVEQGSEFISRDLDLRAYAHNVTLDFSRPGKPTDNAFNGRFRAECLNTHWFLTLADAWEKLEAWHRYNNEERFHGSIGNKVPISLQNLGGAPSPEP